MRLNSAVLGSVFSVFLVSISSAQSQTYGYPASPARAGAIVVNQGGQATVVGIVPQSVDYYRAPAVSTGYEAGQRSLSPSVVTSPLVIDPLDRVVSPEQYRARRAQGEQAPGDSAPLDLPMDADPLRDQRVALAQTRLFDSVPDGIESYFDLYMYVSKADRGPMGQRMFVFERDSATGRLTPYAEWRVSTGREKVEWHKEKRTFTTTPEGMYKLDPNRFYPMWYSRTYDNAPMPHSMFFDMTINGRKTGLAIHAASGAAKIARLGRRDSAGCVRLSPKNAKELFYKVKNTMAGMVPQFDTNERGSTDRWGRVETDSTGNVQLAEGYKALLMIENFDGRGMVGPVVAYTH